MDLQTIIITFGGAVISYLVVENARLKQQLNEMGSLLMRSVAALKEPQDKKRNELADKIIEELKTKFKVGG